MKPIIRYGNGGQIEFHYTKGTAKSLWNKGWDVAQRSHFLIDHYDMVASELDDNVNEYAQKFSHSAWKDLPAPIKKELALHHAMGYYADGGKIQHPKYGIGDMTHLGKITGHRIGNTVKQSSRQVGFKSKPVHEYNIGDDWYNESQVDYYLIESEQKANGGKSQPMKYLTTEKKKIAARITALRAHTNQIKDEETVTAVNRQIDKLEEALNAKTSTKEKVAKWKEAKKARRLGRKISEK
jgi:hypothetical protein